MVSSTRLYLVEVGCKTQIFRSVQELQGVKPYDDEVAVAEKVVEDHWGPWLLKN